MKKVLLNIFVILLCLLMSIAYISKFIVLLFCINALLALVICVKSKFSLFSIKTLTVCYILIPIAYKIFSNNTYGILNIYQGDIYSIQINSLIFLYLAINFFFLNNTKILENEKKLYLRMNNFEISSQNAIIFSILAIVFILIFYPPTFLSNGERFYHLLPGNFWNHFSVIALLFLLPKMKQRKIYVFPWLFVIIWCLIKSERVDAIGLVLLLVMYLWHKKVFHKTTILLFSFLSIILFVSIGYTRQGLNFTSFSDFLFKLLNQSTSADLAYIFDISIDYPKNFGFLLGKTYQTYLYDAINLSSYYNASSMLQNLYGHPGGIFLLSEPYMNFGVFGVVIYSIIENLFYMFLFSRKSKISIIYYLFYLTSVFRYCWYGIEYLETGTIYLIPIMYGIYYLLSNMKSPYGSENIRHFALTKFKWKRL